VSLSRWRTLLPDYHFVGTDKAHGSAAPEGFVTEFNDIVFTFVTGRDADAATTAIQQACTENEMCA
jgi:hypothetical protein